MSGRLPAPAFCRLRPLADESAEIHGYAASAPIDGSTYARAEAALSAFEDLLSFPKRTRMPNLLLVGPTNNGKTMIVEKFRRAHHRLRKPTSEGANIVPFPRCRCPRPG